MAVCAFASDLETRTIYLKAIEVPQRAEGNLLGGKEGARHLLHLITTHSVDLLNYFVR